MARPNLEKMTLKQLLELEVQVQEAIATTREHERTEVKKALAELAEKRGFKLQELMGGRGKGKMSVAKYANPEDSSQTWTGRGRKPIDGVVFKPYSRRGKGPVTKIPVSFHEIVKVVASGGGQGAGSVGVAAFVIVPKAGAGAKVRFKFVIR